MSKYTRKSSFNKGIFFQDSFLFIINQKASPKTHKEGVVIELVFHVPYWACLKTFKLRHGEKVYPSLLLSSNHKFWTKEEGKRRRWQPCFGKMFCGRGIVPVWNCTWIELVRHISPVIQKFEWNRGCLANAGKAEESALQKCPHCLRLFFFEGCISVLCITARHGVNVN